MPLPKPDTHTSPRKRAYSPMMIITESSEKKTADLSLKKTLRLRTINPLILVSPFP